MKIGEDIVGDWAVFFEEIFDDEIVIENLNHINRLYKIGSPRIYPPQRDVFRAFKECPYSKLSVVIILQDPYHDGRATGIGLGNPVDAKMSPSLRIVKDAVSRTIYNYHEFDFDTTLQSWANQGILLINTALTVQEGKPNSHSQLWTRFTKLFFTKLSETDTNIIYCLWGNEARKYKDLINPLSNIILECMHPAASIYKGKPWECDHFREINKHLKYLYNYDIKW